VPRCRAPIGEWTTDPTTCSPIEPLKARLRRRMHRGFGMLAHGPHRDLRRCGYEPTREAGSYGLDLEHNLSWGTARSAD